MAFLRAARVLGVVLVGVLVSVSSLVAMDAVAPPIPCNAFTANFFVYGGYGGFTFGNQKVTDGSQYTFSWKCGQTFTVKVGQINSGWKFAEWFSSSGAFTNPTATSTSFSPAGGPVNIEMVLNRTTASNAAGYVVQRRPTAPGTITEMLAVLYLPTTIAIHPGDTSEELLSVWAGLGGVNGPSAGDYPWAGGVDLVECGVNFPSGAECGSAGFSLLWFYSYGTGKVTSAFQTGVDNAGFLGDQITVDIHYSTSNGTGWLYMKDYTRTGLSFSKVCTPTTCFNGGPAPTVDSAEFVVSGGQQGPVTLVAQSAANLLLPSFDQIRFATYAVYGISSGNPIGYDYTTDSAQWWHQQSVTLAGTPVTQSLYPSILARNVVYTVTGPAIGFPGIDQGGAPPDVQFAVGPRHLLELVNNRANIWNRAGVLVSSATPQAFFAMGSSDYVSDPKVLYDALSGRWFATMIDISQASVYLRVSQASDPTLGWYTYIISGTFAGVSYFQDQPLLGLSGDKVAVTSNDFNRCGLTPCGFVGVQLWIASKSDLIAGLSPRVYISPPTANRNLLSVHPVQTFSTQIYGTTNTLYMVSDWTFPITVTAVTGTPPAVVMTNQTAPIANYMTAPDAPQKGSTNSLSTGDARIQDAFWQAGDIWLTFSDGCYPSGDTVARACVRVVEIYTDGYGGPTVLRDFDTSIAQKYLLYPALRMDSQGNLFVVFGYSSSSDYPSIMTAYLPAGAPAGASLQALTIQVYGTNFITCPSSPCRYGDYFGAATDPGTLSTVWVAAEYGRSAYGSTYVLQL